MKNRIQLTIALQTFNRCEKGYLKQMLESILAQTYCDFELLVMDNHSTDGTADLIFSYNDNRLTYVRQPAGRSATGNITRAVWMARGKFIIPTHDDDVMEPDMIEKQMNFLEQHPGVNCISSNVRLIDESGLPLQPRLYAMENDRVFAPGEYIPVYLKEKFWLPTPTMLFHRKTYMACLPYLVRTVNPVYFPSGDIWSAFLFNLRGSVAILAEPLLHYRQHPGQESRTVDQSEPLLHLIKLLIRYKHDHPMLTEYWPEIYGAFTRFKTQDMLFKNTGKINLGRMTEKIQQIQGEWENAVEPQDRAVDEILPFEILMIELGRTGTIPGKYFRELAPTGTGSGAQKGYRNWLQNLHAGRTIFQNSHGLQNIAIFGSMLTAFLLVLDAHQSGINVVCCLDSSPVRIGTQVWQVPVVPLDQLVNFELLLDAIILSSERDHEVALRNTLSEQGNCHLPVISWKDLADINMVKTG